MPIKTKAAASTSQNLYEKLEDLPEIRKKLYNSILEDFDKQVNARIEQIHSGIAAIQTQIKSQFKVALLKIPRNVRQMKAEELYYANCDLRADLNIECAKVVATISNEINEEVKTNVKVKKPRRVTKKKSSIMAGSSNTVRRSSRKRNAPSWLAETPLASSTMAAAALGGFSAMKSSRLNGANGKPLQTPMITPKFDLATPLNRTVTRTQKADEKFLVSMNGSPVYVGNRGGVAVKKNENLIPLPIGNGKTLMVPADNPDVQPLIQSLINNCMKMMNS